MLKKIILWGFLSYNCSSFSEEVCGVIGMEYSEGWIPYHYKSISSDKEGFSYQLFAYGDTPQEAIERSQKIDQLKVGFFHCLKGLFYDSEIFVPDSLLR